MPLIDGLSKEKKRVALAIVDKLLALEDQAAQYHADINYYKESLQNVGSMEDFFTIVADSVVKGRKAYGILLSAQEGMDVEISNVLQECANENPHLAMILSALHFDKALADSILATKERLSEQEVCRPLSAEQKQTVAEFILNVKKLKLVVEPVELKKAEYQEQLRNASSAEMVDQIEEQIASDDTVMLQIYSKAVTFPDDRAVAGALIDYLEINPQVRELMQIFDFHESLQNDILDARFRVTNTSFGQGSSSLRSPSS